MGILPSFIDGRLLPKLRVVDSDPCVLGDRGCTRSGLGPPGRSAPVRRGTSNADAARIVPPWQGGSALPIVSIAARLAIDGRSPSERRRSSSSSAPVLFDRLRSPGGEVESALAIGKTMRRIKAAAIVQQAFWNCGVRRLLVTRGTQSEVATPCRVNARVGNAQPA